jgi:hypothetical protein
MDKLVKVIGPAPSERLFPSLIALLQAERARISALFSRDVKEPKEPKAPAKRKSKTTLTAKDLEAISRTTGISVEDLMRG